MFAQGVDLYDSYESQVEQTAVNWMMAEWFLFVCLARVNERRRKVRARYRPPHCQTRRARRGLPEIASTVALSSFISLCSHFYVHAFTLSLVHVTSKILRR